LIDGKRDLDAVDFHRRQGRRVAEGAVGPVIVARPGQAEEFALPGNRQRRVFGFDHAAALLNARARQLF